VSTLLFHGTLRTPQLVYAQIEEVSALSKDIRQTCADFTKKVAGDTPA
jgi:hypothetical protein